jgi:hypothetical protein
MVNKPSFLVGIKPDGQAESLFVGTAEECKQRFLTEAENPSGKYSQIQVYRKPPYWKRRDLAKVSATPKAQTGQKPKGKVKN